MGNAVLTAVLLRMRVLRMKWGITFTGMSLASARGLCLSTVVLGAWALVTGRASLPAAGPACVLVAYGVLWGLVYGLVPRRPRFGVFRRPTVRRVGFCALVGGIGVPLFCALGEVPTSPYGPNSWIGGTILAGGLLAVVPYLVAQRRRGIRHQQGLPPLDHPWGFRMVRGAPASRGMGESTRSGPARFGAAGGHSPAGRVGGLPRGIGE